jgi:hypothetical protein
MLPVNCLDLEIHIRDPVKALFGSTPHLESVIRRITFCKDGDDLTNSQCEVQNRKK